MKSQLVLIVALILGLLMRGVGAIDRFNYNHDNDLSSWIIKDIVVDHHPRLIGQLTSEQGIFIGPLFYYALIPFYWLSNWDPIGGLALSILIGVVGIISSWHIFRKLYGDSTGNVAALGYAVSFGLSQAERDVVPTTPVFLWAIWFFYGINLLFRGEKKGLIILGILIGLICLYLRRLRKR